MPKNDSSTSKEGTSKKKNVVARGAAVGAAGGTGLGAWHGTNVVRERGKSLKGSKQTLKASKAAVQKETKKLKASNTPHRQANLSEAKGDLKAASLTVKQNKKLYVKAVKKLPARVATRAAVGAMAGAAVGRAAVLGAKKISGRSSERIPPQFMTRKGKAS